MNTIAEEQIVQAVSEALEKSKELGRKFTQSVDLAITLKNVDLNLPKNRIDEDIILPHGRGKQAKVGVFARVKVPPRPRMSLMSSSSRSSSKTCRRTSARSRRPPTR